MTIGDRMDELFEEAKALVIKEGYCSGSLLQQHFKIGYNLAGRLIDELENKGIVGQFEGSKKRNVLMCGDLEQGISDIYKEVGTVQSTNINYKINTHYIVTKGNSDGSIIKGDTLLIHYSSTHGREYRYTMFLPPGERQPNFFGLAPLNKCIYFDTKEKLSAVMNELELKYDTKLVQDMIDGYQNKIDKLKTNHEI